MIGSVRSMRTASTESYDQVLAIRLELASLGAMADGVIRQSRRERNRSALFGAYHVVRDITMFAAAGMAFYGA